jgi:hypothetical protein
MFTGSATVLQSGPSERADDRHPFQKVVLDIPERENALYLHADVVPPAPGMTVSWARGWLSWQDDGLERARIVEWIDDRKRWWG